MNEVVFLLEEPSAKALLEGLLPRVLPNSVQPRFIVFEGKQDLEKGMVRKLRAWRTPDAKFVVLRDQDSGDCKNVKAVLQKKCEEANRADALVRIACRELEAWILGDLQAFATEFGVAKAERQRNKGTFANPDLVGRPVEELKKFYPLYMKVEGARRMGLVLDPATNASNSFKQFCSGLVRMVAG